MQSITIIVPTYEEVKNIPLLIQEISKMKNNSSLDIGLLIVDDNSRDGTKELLESINEKWVHYVIRNTDRSLSRSVIEGFNRATGDIIVVMDADLSHPVDMVPKLIESVSNGFDFAVGSRYANGGTTDETWSLFRHLNSWFATILARPLTKLHDPMTGFFAFRRSILKDIDPLTPTGYKIGLEMIVKSKSDKISELPIHFRNRKFGTSKLSFKEQLKYIKHLRRLYMYKYPELSSLTQFLVVGGTGVVVNLLVLTVALELGFSSKLSLLMGILVSIISNFALNRRFSFSYAREGNIYTQFINFVMASSLGALTNYFVAIFSLYLDPQMAVQLAALYGIATGTVINYCLNRYLVFRKEEQIKKKS